MRKLLLSILIILSLSTFAIVNADYQSPIVNVVKATAPAVVKIDVVSQTEIYIDPFIREFYKQFFGDIPRQFEESNSVGSGFIISKEGYIVTNFHVIQGAKKITVTMLDGSVYDAEYIGGDEELDLAVIKIKPTKTLPVLELGDSDKLNIGEWAIAIGNPLGFQHTVTVGVVSATGRKIPKPDGSGYYTGLIQTDAAINPGNSGGPLLNIYGQVIGINTAIINPTQASNIGFAIPINTAKRFINQIIATGKVEKAYLGVYIQTVTEALAKSLGLKVSKGVYISQVEKGSPAEKAGIKEGDVIVKFNGNIVESAEELTSMTRNYTPGTKVKIVVNRSGKELIIDVTLGKLPSQTSSGVSESAKEFFNMKVSDITANDRSTYKIPAGLDGVIVKQSTNSYIKVGAVIYRISVNGYSYDVKSVNDWNKVVENVKKGDYIGIFYYYNGVNTVFSFRY
ncbi:MAG: Do family serine endopeptidase [Fervidobacterium sp.]|uniref:Do/DeqQ family serine protease n=1 Tax=Fervidobacterium gondwanense DSM 13020 TaxID=1121883 RepID=A0A1M7SME3_FERGO|nr:Do family serine endopeptidase [Fervidobacterium gondwanense]UXF01468.1 serine protease [Fervidobacterium riparium]SHN59629.1 Do/DeqQ family serine protease [Fervidobacterium gondwanense DSM 13020]